MPWTRSRSTPVRRTRTPRSGGSLRRASRSPGWRRSTPPTPATRSPPRLRCWAQRIGVGIANAINTFDPEEVVIGGGAARAGDLLLAPAREVAAGFVVPGLGRGTTIRVARHGVRAGVLGAALLAVHELAEAPAPAPTEVPR